MDYKYTKFELLHIFIPIIQIILLTVNKDLLLYFIEGIMLSWIIFKNNCFLHYADMNSLNDIIMKSPYPTLLMPLHYFTYLYIFYLLLVTDRISKISKILIFIYLISLFDGFRFIYNSNFRYIIFAILIYVFHSTNKNVNKKIRNVSIIFSYIIFLYFRNSFTEFNSLYELELLLVFMLFYSNKIIY